jgi:hypothetical protein
MAMRANEQREALAAAGLDELVKRGLKPSATITYSELNNHMAEVTGQPPFDLSTEQGRHELGLVLELINERAHPLVGDKVLITSLVLHKGGEDLGKGFYAYAQSKKLLFSDATEYDKLEFLIDQMHKARIALRAVLAK